MTYTCPNGHKIEAGERESVECEPCDLVATHSDGATGEVYTWTPREEYRERCMALQDAMDDADQSFCGDW